MIWHVCCLYLPSFPYHQPTSPPPLYSVLAFTPPSSFLNASPLSFLHPSILDSSCLRSSFLPPQSISSFSPRSISSILPSLFLFSSIYFFNPSLPLPSLLDLFLQSFPPSSFSPRSISSILPSLLLLSSIYFFSPSLPPPSLLDLFLQSFLLSSFSPRFISSILSSLFLFSSIYFFNPSLPPPSLLFSFSFLSSETGYRGMWHDPDHLAERSHCLNQLARIYNWTLPLQYSDIAAIQFQRT